MPTRTLPQQRRIVQLDFTLEIAPHGAVLTFGETDNLDDQLDRALDELPEDSLLVGISYTPVGQEVWHFEW